MSARPKSTSTTSKGGGKSKSATSKAVVPRARQDVAPRGRGRSSQGEQSIICPVGYKARPVQAAKNYDVISFARAMNDDMGPRVKKLFDPERVAAIQALETGIYIGWRCSDYKHDCQRVSNDSKCFCGHLLKEHDKYTGRSVRVPCKSGGCRCKAFDFCPSRPEEVGEFWFQRRRNFDPSAWRIKCKCKHTHEEHDPNGLRRCKSCGCGAFNSASVCAACDRHWEQHETVFETQQMRVENGFPVGEDYFPFAEIPSLRNMALTGHDDEDMSYMSVMQPPDMSRLPLPSSSGPADNSTVVPFGAQAKKSGFKPVYD